MAREYPEGLVYEKVTNGKRTWQVFFSQHKAYRFLLEILPFLLVKHEQAKVALSFLAHKRRDHAQGWQKGQPRGTKLPECERCKRAAATVLALRAEVKDVNSVNALLTHEMREYRAKPEEVAQDVEWMTSKMRELQEGLETRLSESNKAISASEKDIVQQAA
jgi:FtsZ-binding cell division protein ZapB